MNPNVLTLIGGALGILVAVWTIAANLGKRNSDRFDALQKEIGAMKDSSEMRSAPPRTCYNIR